MHRKLLLCLILSTWHVANCLNFSLITAVSDQIRQREEIDSLAVFFQKSFVTNMGGYEELLRHENAIVPLVLIGEDYTGNHTLGNIIGLRSSAIVFIETIDNEKIILLLNVTLRQIRTIKLLIVLKKCPKFTESLMRFFQSCRRLGIVNVVVMCDDQVLTYRPYPEVSIENITSAPIKDYYPDRLYNLNGYVFRTPIKQDASRVFIYKDSKGNEKITGTDAQLYMHFVMRHNATFEKHNDDNDGLGFDIVRGMKLVRQGICDILMHSYTSFAPDNIGFSYPKSQIELQLVVPAAGETPTYRYLILPFDFEVWICLAISFLYISIVSYLTRWYCQRLPEYGPVFTRTLAEFLYLSSTDLACNLRTLVLEMQVFLYGLMLTNIYAAFLSAFLTTSVQDKQIDSFEDVYQSKYNIVQIDYEVVALKHMAGYNKRYDNIFYVQNVDFINEYRKSLNRTFGFVFANDRAKFFLGQQNYLEKKRMYIAKTKYGSYFLVFLMQNDSPFRFNFDKILLQLYDSGLYKKWEEDTFNQAVSSKYLEIFRTESEDLLRPLTIEYLGVGWATLGIGLGLSAVVFLAEMVRFKMGQVNREK